MLRQDVPASPEAYEHYLRANRLSTSATQWMLARDLYTARGRGGSVVCAGVGAARHGCSATSASTGARRTHEPHYQRAEEAFQRAFALNPELPLTHNLYTYMEVETGRALDAVLRLLGRLKTRTNDPDLFAGLVQACRYVGLLDASVAAYHRATRLDPGIVDQRGALVLHARPVSARHRDRSRSAAVRLDHRASRARPVRGSRGAVRAATCPPRRESARRADDAAVRRDRSPAATPRAARRSRSSRLSGLQRSGRLVLLGAGGGAGRRRVVRDGTARRAVTTGFPCPRALEIYAAARSAARSGGVRGAARHRPRGARSRGRSRSPRPTVIACSDCRAHDGGSSGRSRFNRQPTGSSCRGSSRCCSAPASS